MNNTLPDQNKIDAVKMIVCDLDGTLLMHNKKIGNHTAELLISLQQKGYLLALASGRFFYELEPYIKQLNMKKYNGIALCANGSEVHDLTDDSLFCFDKLSKEESLKIIEVAKKAHITCYVNYNDQYYISLCLLHKIAIYIVKMLLYPFRGIFVNNHLIKTLWNLCFVNNVNDKIGELHKICFFASPKKLRKFENRINGWHQHYVFYFVNKRAIEITHRSVGKYEGIQYICQKKNITVENVIAFGDSGNDVKLIEHAGIGVAMQNAFPEVKATTIYHTDKNNQNEGVYDYLKRLKL